MTEEGLGPIGGFDRSAHETLEKVGPRKTLV